MSTKSNVSPPPIKEPITSGLLGLVPQSWIRYFTDLNKSVNYLREIILNITADYSPTIEHQTMICDATAGEITITLPLSAKCFTNERSIKYAVFKKDITANKVIIVGSGGELIVRETTQELLYDGEVLNFVTDGLNWYLGA